MKKTFGIIIILLLLSLCACGPKTQPAPTEAPTAVPTEVPTEVPAETAPETNTETDAGPAAEPEEKAVPDSYDPSDPDSVLRYYDARGEEMYGSYAFQQLDTEGKTVWTAPLAGIKEFKVPEAFLNAKGNIRAGGGEELYLGTGLVNLDVVYLPYQKADFTAFLKKIAEYSKIQDPTDEDIQNYVEMVQEYNNNAYHLFAIMGIGNNGTLEDLKALLKEHFLRNDLTEEAIDQLFEASEFIEAGSAEDYNFYMIKRGYGSAFFEESQEEYREEFDALYDAAESYTANFTFMRPLALAQMVAEGTGLKFETKDLKDNPVNSGDLFSSHKVTMLNIWETTCSSCMTEMPELKKMAKEFEANGGQLVGLVYDAMEDDLIREAKEIADDLDLNFVNLLPTQEMKDFFKAQAFPTTYFFNEKGEVIGNPVVGANTDEYTAIMNELLGK